MLLCILVALVCGVLATGYRPTIVTLPARVRVEQGDTLWSIARNHPIPGRTTAQTADAIVQLSNLHGSAVRTGQVLLVPTTRDGVTVASR